MKTTLIVHEDNQPFVRFEQFTKREPLKRMIARTHNALLDEGYALVDTRERDSQRAMTYDYVKLRDETRHKVYMVVSNE